MAIMHDDNCLAFPFQIKLLKTLIVTKDTYVNGLESLKVKAIFKCIIDGAEEWEIPTYQSILRNPSIAIGDSVKYWEFSCRRSLKGIHHNNYLITRWVAKCASQSSATNLKVRLKIR